MLEPSLQHTSTQGDVKLPRVLPLHLRVMGRTSRVVAVGDADLIVGSDPGCDVVIDDDLHVSGRHLRLRRTDKGVRVQDLGSRNGTFVTAPGDKVGGSRIGWRFMWRPGLWLRIGETALVLEVVPPPSLSTADFHGLVGRSPTMQRLYGEISALGPLATNVFIHGETGSGKELVAGALHRTSARKGKPFVAINCATLRGDLVASELFGHVRGAFTGADRDHDGAFANAHGGTLFLDEIAELPLPAQAMMLRVLESREVTRVGETTPRKVDVRVVTASHTGLSGLVRAKTFRKDLFYRLVQHQLPVPSLLERIEDLPDLVLRFTAWLPGEKKAVWSDEAMERLKQHLWPGNVRELRSVVLVAASRAVTEGRLVQPGDVHFIEDPDATPAPASLKPGVNGQRTDDENDGPATGTRRVDPVKVAQARSLHVGGESPAQIATRLGVSERTVYRWLAPNPPRDEEQSPGNSDAPAPPDGPPRRR